MIYQAIFDRASDGTIWGRVPEISGAYGSGDTLEEAQASLAESVKLYIEEMRADGMEFPTPSTIAIMPIAVDAA